VIDVLARVKVTRLGSVRQDMGLRLLLRNCFLLILELHSLVGCVPLLQARDIGLIAWDPLPLPVCLTLVVYVHLFSD
jgi:hypothetical protein